MRCPLVFARFKPFPIAVDSVSISEFPSRTISQPSLNRFIEFLSGDMWILYFLPLNEDSTSHFERLGNDFELPLAVVIDRTHFLAIGLEKKGKALCSPSDLILLAGHTVGEPGMDSVDNDGLEAALTATLRCLRS